MKNRTSLLYLTPRFLGSLFVLLIFSFLIELTAEEFNINLLLAALIPGLLVLTLLIIAWFKEGIGGWLFIILGIFCLLYLFATAREFYLVYFILPGWSIVIGLLFIMNKYK